MTARKSPRRQVFVLTPDEKKAVFCIVGAFLLGLATMQYRAAHPRPAPPPSATEKKAVGKRASTSRARTSPSPSRRRTPTPAPAPDADEA